VGLPSDDPDVVKGRAGSLVAVRDYFDVCPDYAQQPANRLDEFVTFPAATILLSRLQRKRLRVKRNLEGEFAWMNALELLLAFYVLLGLLGLLIAFWP
jgi:hypothetical protein